MSWGKSISDNVAPLRVFENYYDDSITIVGAREREVIARSAFVATNERPRLLIIDAIGHMAKRDVVVQRYIQHLALEIHPVFADASIPDLLAGPDIYE